MTIRALLNACISREGLQQDKQAIMSDNIEAAQMKCPTFGCPLAEDQQNQGSEMAPHQIQFFGDFASQDTVSTEFEEMVSQPTASEHRPSPTADDFDIRRAGRGPSALQHSDSVRLGNEILLTAKQLYLCPAISVEGISDLRQHFAVFVGGESGVYRADLWVLVQNGWVFGKSAPTRVEALQRLLDRLNDHLMNWRLNVALGGQ